MSDTNTKIQFLAYIEDDGKTVEGYFQIQKITDSYIEFISHGNIVRIPWHRILKNKEKQIRKNELNK